MWHRALILLRDRPHCLSAASFAAHRKSASVSPAMASIRAQMLRAAAAETCWPVTARARKAVTPLSSRSGNQIGAAAMCARSSGDTVPAMAISRRCSSGSIVFPAERRQVLFQLVHFVLNGHGFAPEKIRHRAAETGVADPVGAIGRLRQIPALDFVWALRTGLHALQAAGD